MSDENNPASKRCGQSNYSPAFDDTFLKTNEFHSLWPMSDAVILNPYYEQNPEYDVEFKRRCLTKGCGMTLIERAIRQGKPPKHLSK